MAREPRIGKKPIEQYAHKGKKREFLDEWIRAINHHGGFGQWAWAVSKNPADLKGILITYSDGKR